MVFIWSSFGQNQPFIQIALAIQWSANMIYKGNDNYGKRENSS